MKNYCSLDLILTLRIASKMPAARRHIDGTEKPGGLTRPVGLKVEESYQETVYSSPSLNTLSRVFNNVSALKGLTRKVATARLANSVNLCFSTIPLAAMILTLGLIFCNVRIVPPPSR